VTWLDSEQQRPKKQTDFDVHQGWRAGPSAPLLDSAAGASFNALVKSIFVLKLSALTAIALAVLSGCATSEPTLPPERIAPPAANPAQVQSALPGEWFIDVDASADALARAQYRPRQTTLIHRDGDAPPKREVGTVIERFDPKAYREALTYWLGVLNKTDMRWRIKFNADGSGEHVAVVKTGSPAQGIPFKWKLDGWVLHITYAEGAPFKSFTIEVPSAQEWHYPMQPLGDHLVLRRVKR
jgi:hypothetical protein